MGKCIECEFCFLNKEGYICADAFYGQNITETIKEDKECYSESFNVFSERSKSEEEDYPRGTKLESLKIHKSKRIYLQDLNKNVVSIKFKQSIGLFKDVDVVKNLNFNHYQIKYFFEDEMMKGSKFIIIK